MFMKNNKKIALYYDSVEVAGAETQLITLANYFINDGHEVYLYDNDKNIISARCPGIVSMRYGEYLHSCDYFIYFMSHILEVECNTNINIVGKEIVWNVHPDNIYWVFPIMSSARKILNSFFLNLMMRLIHPKQHYKVVKKIKKNNLVCVFMDGMNYRSFNYLFPELVRPLYLPICVNPFKKDIAFDKINNKTKKILFLGRLVDFKVRPLLNLLKFLDGVNGYDFEIKIVGTGPCESELRKFTSSNIRVSFLGNLYEDELDKVVGSCNMAFSMGTAALDLALKRIPVLLSPIKGDVTKYCWLYQTKFNNMAVTKINALLDIDEVLENLKDDREFIIQKNYNYVLSNHAVKNVVRIIFNETVS